jgi:MFS family permease
LDVFKQWQFASAGVVIAFTGTAIYGSTYLIPIFVQVVQNYSPTSAGVMMIPAGLAMVVGFPVAGRLSDRFDARVLLAFGVACFGASMYLMAGVSAASPYWTFIGWIVLSRVGISFCMPPANTTAIRGVPANLLASAAGAASFLMQVGGAFGVSMLAILLQRRNIFHGEHISSAMTESNPELLYQHQQNMWAAMASGEPFQQAYFSAFRPIADTVRREAMVLAFRDCFLVCACGFAIVLAFILLMPKPENKAAQP